MNPPSKQSLKLSIDGASYTVEIDDISASPIRVRVNGQDYQAQIEGEQTIISTRPETQPTAVGAPPAGPAPRRSTPSPTITSTNEIYAPMPGDILNIQVQAGDQVEVGDQICALEAMKMKSAIRSARAGVIASVLVSEGQAVAHGDVLVTFEQG